MDDLGSRVRAYRLQKHWSVRDLARIAGVSVSYVYAVESGQRGRNIAKLEKIAAALGVQVSTLWEGSQKP